MRQDGRHLGVGGLEILGMFRAGIDLGDDVRAAGKDARQLDLLGFQPSHGLVEELQPFLVADLRQGGVVPAFVGEGSAKTGMVGW